MHFYAEDVCDFFYSYLLLFSLSACIQTQYYAAPKLDILVSPLFNAGSLAANEDISRLTKQQVELNYMDQVYQAFAEVENGMLQERNLQTRYARLSEAETNALVAEELSFEQYLKGIVSYTNVLDAKLLNSNKTSTITPGEYSNYGPC
ncbi:TolC family protein [Thalassotalea piscium]